MCCSDRERYKREWENDPELNTSVPLDEYIYNREMDDYGLCDDELGVEDNEDYDS